MIKTSEVLTYVEPTNHR